MLIGLSYLDHRRFPSKTTKNTARLWEETSINQVCFAVFYQLENPDHEMFVLSNKGGHRGDERRMIHIQIRREVDDGK